MKKTQINKTLLAALFLALTAQPALAQEDSTGTGSESEQTKLKEPIKAPALKKRNDDDLPPVKSGSKSDVAIPVRLASFTTGVIFGTPVSVVRAFARQTKAGSKDLIGESHNPVLVASTYLFSLPFAFAGAPFEGVGMSIMNSWNGSGEEPFGKETFSMQANDE